jgi:hypothetical protein
MTGANEPFMRPIVARLGSVLSARNVKGGNARALPFDVAEVRFKHSSATRFGTRKPLNCASQNWSGPECCKQPLRMIQSTNAVRPASGYG